MTGRQRSRLGSAGWAGPVFWPYAYASMLGYVFAPWDEDPFWGYGPDDVVAALLWPYPWPPSAGVGYGYSDLGLPLGDHEVHRRRHARSHRTEQGPEAAAEVARMCGDRADQLAGLSMEQIERTVGPTEAQRGDLDALETAFGKANEILAGSCSSEVPLTPPGRLAAMERRLEAMRQAVDVIRPPLEKLYGALDEAQKARFDAMRGDAGPRARHHRDHAGQSMAAAGDFCRAQTPDAAAFPEQEIEKAVNPTDAQRAALEDLRAAAAKAADLVKDSCPAQMPPTPVGRLAAVRTRLDAMLRAVQTERPALDKFYGSLDDEQKAQFNALRPPQAAPHRG